MDPYPLPFSLSTYFIVILVLLLLNALLTAGRTALTMLNDSSVKKMATSDDKNARFIAQLLEHPSAFLDGVKLAGFTCTVLCAVFSYLIAVRFLPSVEGEAQILAYYGLRVLILLGIVLVLDVLCLRFPYRIACRHPQGTAFALARLCAFVSVLFRPFVWLNTLLARLFGSLFGVGQQEEPEQVTEEEIRLMVDVGNEKGAIEQSEKEMINNIFEFDDRNVSEVMTHRTDMTAVSNDRPLDEIVSLAIETGFSRIPVYQDDIDDIIGIIYVKDLLCLIGKHNEHFNVQNYMRPALFVPENMSCIDLFAQFKQKKVMVAIAVDEYGGTAGIVSMEDLLESIVGNIQDEYDDEEEEISRISEGCYIIDGTVGIDEVEKLFQIELDEDSDYDTIGGLLTDKLERLPGVDEHPSVELAGVRFTVLLVEERRIARIRAEKLEPPLEESTKK